MPTPAPTPTPTPPTYAAPVAPSAGYVITTSNIQPVRSANDTPEFRRNYGSSEFMNGLYALDAGHRGQGVIVAVMDDGVLNVNGELDGRIDATLSKDFGYTIKGGVRTKRNELGSAASDHGTAVANIIAAGANGSGTVGFAPSAGIAVLRVSDWDEDTGTDPLYHVVEAMEYATASRIKIVNSSLGNGTSPVWQDTVARFAQTGGLLVNSAGNNGGASPNDAGMLTAANRNAVIFVGALSPNINAYTMEPYSNLAGTAMDRYVVAVGSNVTTKVDGNVGVFSGTSSAAPVVSALAADILSKWPQLTGQQAGEVILGTAKDLGEPGTDAVFGRGLVDFQAALSPVNPKLSNGATQTSVDSSMMAVPPAIAIRSIQTALSKVTVLDAFGRDYTGSIAALVVQPQLARGKWIQRRVRDMNAAWGLRAGGFSGSVGYTSVQVGPAASDVRTRATAGEIAYAHEGWGARAAWNRGETLQSDIMGLAAMSDGVLAYAPLAASAIGVDRYRADGSRFSLTVAAGGDDDARASAATLGWSKGATDIRVSVIGERGTVLGMQTGTGALRLGAGATTTLLEAHRTFGGGMGWSLEVYGSAGVTRLKIARASLVTGATPILGSRLGVQAGRDMLGGRILFGIAQPLAIEAGAARLTYGSGYDLADRRLTYATTSAALAGRRRLQLSAGYTTGGPLSRLRLGVANDANDGTVAALAGWTGRF